MITHTYTRTHSPSFTPNVLYTYSVWHPPEHSQHLPCIWGDIMWIWKGWCSHMLDTTDWNVPRKKAIKIKRGKVSNAHQHLISDKEDRRIQDKWGNWRMDIAKTDVRIETQIGRSYLNRRLKKNYLYKLRKHRGRKLHSHKQHMVEDVTLLSYHCWCFLFFIMQTKEKKN